MFYTILDFLSSINSPCLIFGVIGAFLLTFKAKYSLVELLEKNDLAAVVFAILGLAAAIWFGGWLSNVWFF